MALTRAVTDFKDSVKVATTSNITLSGGAPSTIDGFSLSVNDSVLVRAQDTPSQNGIYRVTTLGTGSNGTWTRRSDFNASNQITAGALIFVEQGTNNGNTYHYLAGGLGTVTVDSTSFTFSNLYNTIASSVAGIVYSNSNVAAYLPTYTGNISAGNLTLTGNLIVTNTEYVNATEYANVQIANTVNAGTIGNSGALIQGDTFKSFNGGQHIGYHTGAIGANTANTGVFTSVTITSGGQVTGYLTGALGANTPNTVVATSVTTVNGGQLTGYVTGPIGANTPNSGAFTSISITGASTANSYTSLYGGQLTGYITGPIGANTANSGVFTSLATVSGGQVTGYMTGPIGANTANTGVFTSVTTTNGGQVTGYMTGPIGANTPNSGAFTSVSITGASTANSYTSLYGGQLNGYHTGPIGANTANTGAFTSVTVTSLITSSGGQITGYHTGPIGANTANTGAFTSLTASSTITASSDVSGSRLLSTFSGGDEGGEIILAKAATNTTLNTSITIDIFQNRLRFYETGGTNKGVFIDLSAANATVGTNLLSGAGSPPGGSNTYVQFNDSSAYGGSSNFTFNKTTGQVTADTFNSTNNGAGTNFKVGDDAWIGDVNTANTIGVRGQQDSTQGYIIFGSTNSTNYIGRSGANPITVTGAFAVTGTANIGNVTTTSGVYWANGQAYSSGTTYSNSNVAAYLPTYSGALTASSLTTLSGGQHIGYHTGAIGANTANTGAFTTLTATSTSNPTASLTDSTVGTSANKLLSMTAGTNNVWFSPNVGSGSYNPIVSANDIILGFQGASQGTGALTLTPWATASGGIRISCAANVTTITSTTIVPAANVTYNLGSTTSNWNNVYAVTFSGTATTAKYADLAENYLSDEPLDPGDVVIFGGRKEIKSSYRYADTRIAGVISTNPAYLMNSDLEDSYPVALTGRVPCKVLGPVSKGDVLTTSNIVGVAMTLDKQDFAPGCVLGKSLEDHAFNTIKTIEIVVGRF